MAEQLKQLFLYGTSSDGKVTVEKLMASKKAIDNISGMSTTSSGDESTSADDGSTCAAGAQDTEKNSDALMHPKLSLVYETLQKLDRRQMASMVVDLARRVAELEEQVTEHQQKAEEKKREADLGSKRLLNLLQAPRAYRS